MSSPTSPNPNGYIAVVFTYSGSVYSSYQDFLKAFYVTLPGGAGVQLGATEYCGYVPKAKQPTLLTLGTSYALSSAASALSGLLPTNTPASAVQNLTKALANWAATQAASTGQTNYANLYLHHYTGGRIYLSNGALGLGTSGEPTPVMPSDPAYAIVYDLFEPYIGAQVGGSTIPGNGADVTDIDWFSFPITLKIWYYDFSKANVTVLTQNGGAAGGSGQAIYKALDIPGSTTSPTNQYPNASLPASGGSSTAVRLVGPTAAAAAQSYYTDPAKDPFPYHYFDDYLRYLAAHQGTVRSLFTLSGEYAGNSVGNGANYEAQSFSFEVDFSGITTQSYRYPSGSVKQIAPGSQIVLTGYTAKFGSQKQPFTITLPWAKGTSTYELPLSNGADAVQQGWLTLPTAVPAGPSGTYPSANAQPTVTALDAKGNTLPPQSGSIVLQLVFSVNSQPLGGSLDNLYNNGSPTMIAISNTSGLTLDASATYTQGCDQKSASSAIVTIVTDAQGNFQSITISDQIAAPGIAKGSTWTIPAQATGLGNNQSFVITLAQNPPLRNVLILNSGTYLSAPASLQVSCDAFTTFQLKVTASGSMLAGWQTDTTWTTLSQPAGIYGANSGYVIAGIQGTSSSFNRDVKALFNDVFGWIVADLLAALNCGFVGSPVTYTPHGLPPKPLGQYADQWFNSSGNPYTADLWGAKAWAGVKDSNGDPIDNFWNTWAYRLSTVSGGTNAYGFAFTDRFAPGILVPFNPPPSNPTASSPVLLEVIVGDSPLLKH